VEAMNIVDQRKEKLESAAKYLRETYPGMLSGTSNACWELKATIYILQKLDYPQCDRRWMQGYISGLLGTPIVD